MTKKAIRKKIVEKCKKTTKCLQCKEVNGFVKKMTASKTGTGGSVLKIVHEKFKGKDKDTIVQTQIGKDFVNVQGSMAFRALGSGRNERCFATTL